MTDGSVGNNDDEGFDRPPTEDEDEEDEDESGEEEADGPLTPPLAPEAEAADDVSSTLRQKREEDINKGKAIARQIASIFFLFSLLFPEPPQAIWDSLLDARIRLQKAVTASNRLPVVRTPH
jgi:protein AATF/BFR2